MTPARRLDWLQGQWRVLRAIRHADGTRARFTGHATWDGARCVEAGTLHAHGAAMPARRETLWSVEDGALVVRFADGRFFHAVAAGWAGHACPPDRYRVRHAWFPDRFAVRWRVTGPRKDYGAIAWHIRAAAP